MNTQTFDSNPLPNASKNCSRQFHSSVPHPVTSHRKSFKNHLPLHPNRCQYRNGRWGPAPRLASWIRDLLKARHSSVYQAICRKVDPLTQQGLVPYRWIANELKCSEKTVERSFHHLRDLGLIESRKTCLGNVTTVLEPPTHPTEVSGGKAYKAEEPQPTPPNPQSAALAEELIAAMGIAGGEKEILDACHEELAQKPVHEAKEKLCSEWQRWRVIAVLFPNITPEKFWRVDRHYLPGLEVDAARKLEQIAQRKAENEAFHARNKARSRAQWYRQHHEPRVHQRNHSEGPLTVEQRSALRIMAELGEPQGFRRTRDILADAIGQWMRKNPDKGPESAVEPLVAERRDFERAYHSGLLWRKYSLGVASFFESYWRDRDSWGWDTQGARIAAEARVGRHKEPEDLAAYNEKWDREMFRTWYGAKENFRQENPWDGEIYPDIIKEIDECRRQKEQNAQPAKG